MSVFGVELPIIQAPMAGVQDSTLATAVSNAGGLGSLPCAMLDPETMRSELDKLRRQTDRPFNVNFFCHQPPTHDRAREKAWRELLTPYFQELGIDPVQIPQGPARTPFSAEAAEVLEEFQPAVVSFHFGLPAPELLKRVRRLAACILSSATTLQEALWLEQQGVDAVIAQGIEAGGHRGCFLNDDLSAQPGTAVLLEQIVNAVKVPVIAAGGIADAQTVSAMLNAGATAVQVGSAYLLCPEATTSQVHRAALKTEAARHTAVTNLFTGRPARGIVNRIIRELGPMNSMAPAFPLAAAAIAPLRSQAEAQGSGDFSSLWSGQSNSGFREMPAAALTRELTGL